MLIPDLCLYRKMFCIYKKDLAGSEGCMHMLIPKIGYADNGGSLTDCTHYSLLTTHFSLTPQGPASSRLPGGVA